MTFRRVPPEAPRTRFSARYDRFADAFGADRIVGRWELARALDVPPRVPWTAVPHAVGDLPADLSFVTSTSHGIVVWADGRPRMLSPGRHFGLTLRDGRLYAFQITGRHGRIVSFPLGPDHVPEPGGGWRMVTHLYGLSRWVHQIDFVDDELVVVDTLRNRLLCYPDVDRRSGRHWSTAHRTVQLTPADRKGRASPHYRHFNSVYRHGDTIYVVAHNHSAGTGRKSDVWLLDEEFRLREIVPAGGMCCHNVVIHERGMLVCRSVEQTVALDGVDVLTTEGFGRGLAYDGRHLLVGASLFAEEYADRDHDDGFVDVYSADFTLVGRVVFPRSSIRDIRLLAGDRGLSNHSRKEAGPNGRDHV
ncbi:hypothetical protein ACIBCR_03525 [Micromonospora echinospora]|uniref:hypothetical protein n=1 Tax=Micromonospora echinospora TaxID=1877 RepID=UPI0037A9DF15